jgi:hypothetical protein
VTDPPPLWSPPRKSGNAPVTPSGDPA